MNKRILILIIVIILLVFIGYFFSLRLPSSNSNNKVVEVITKNETVELPISQLLTSFSDEDKKILSDVPIERTLMSKSSYSDLVSVNAFNYHFKTPWGIGTITKSFPADKPIKTSGTVAFKNKNVINIIDLSHENINPLIDIAESLDVETSYTLEKFLGKDITRYGLDRFIYSVTPEKISKSSSFDELDAMKTAAKFKINSYNAFGPVREVIKTKNYTFIYQDSKSSTLLTVYINSGDNYYPAISINVKPKIDRETLDIIISTLDGGVL